jgi:hypothetical protein
MFENTSENYLVRTLKSILWTLLLASSRLNKGALARVSGYTDKPVSMALTLLTEMGLVEGKDREGWHPPPSGFLALAQYWPEIGGHERALMIDSFKNGFSCEQLAQFWSHKYPALTAEAFVALLALSLDVPGELESAKSRGITKGPHIAGAAPLASSDQQSRPGQKGEGLVQVPLDYF